MFCKSCGNELKEGAKFCPECGTAVEAGSRASAPTKPKPSNETGYYMDSAVIQEIFAQMRANEFIKSQTIRERWDREKRNAYYTENFRAAFDSILRGDSGSAKKYCKSLKRKEFKWLLYAEMEWHYEVHKRPLPPCETLAFAFGIAEKKLEKFVQKAHEKLPLSRFAEKSYSAFVDFKEHEENYKKLPVKNIAVCATMSAGKSTFVNALLGHDVLPARNEATTAKVTSVYDKDGAERIVGFVNTRDNQNADLCGDVKFSKIDEWNSSSGVSRIFLQGDLDGIKNNGAIVAVHDTPGTNNSGDKNHHDVTFDFLQGNKMDALIFVANAEHLATTDEKALLTELHQKVASQRNIPVIFVLNKADNIDTEKESLDSLVADYKDFVAQIGFADARIFPVSAKAARLLKMARSARCKNFTSKEQRECALMLEQFTELHDFRTGESRLVEDTDSEQIVEIGNKRIPLSEVCVALERTGLPQAEKYIERLL